MTHHRGISIPIIDGSGHCLVQVDEADDAEDPHFLVVDPNEQPQPEELSRRPKHERDASERKRRRPRTSRNNVARRLRFVGSLLAALLVASVAHAQDNGSPEPGEELTVARLVSDSEDVSEPPILRPQLVHHDRKAVVVTGVAASLIGVGFFVASWAVYVARQDYRLRAHSVVDPNVIDSWESRGAWALWLSVGSAASFVAAEYILLPEERDVPTLAWFAGGAGLITAAIGLVYSVGGTHCAPQAAAPGASLLRDCQSGTADALFRPMLLLTSAPLLNVPLTYLLRSLFAEAPESLSFTPSGILVRGTF